MFELFDEYASAYARGERPRAAEFLERAGPDADELAALLDRFLVASPRGEPDAQTVALVGAWLEGEPPLVGLRVARGIRVDGVAQELVSRLGLDPGKRAKVKRLYQELEKGLLEPARVSERVWAALGAVLGPAVEQARRWRPAELRGAAAAYYRRTSFEPLSADLVAGVPMMRPSMQQADAEPPDEIDRLFGVTDR